MYFNTNIHQVYSFVFLIQCGENYNDPGYDGSADSSGTSFQHWKNRVIYSWLEFLQVLPLGLPHCQYLRTWEKCKFLSPTSDLLTQKFWDWAQKSVLHQVPQVCLVHLKFENNFPIQESDHTISESLVSQKWSGVVLPERERNR